MYAQWSRFRFFIQQFFLIRLARLQAKQIQSTCMLYTQTELNDFQHGFAVTTQILDHSQHRIYYALFCGDHLQNIQLQASPHELLQRTSKNDPQISVSSAA